MVFQAPLFGQAGGDGPGGAFMGTGIQRTYSAGHQLRPHLSSHAGDGSSRLASRTTTTIAQTFRLRHQRFDRPRRFPASISTSSPAALSALTLNDGISQPMIGYSASLPWVRSEANVDLVNTWTKTKGNHTFKWGVDLKRVRDNLLQDQTYSPRGIYYFGNEQTALCTADCYRLERSGDQLQLLQAGRRQRRGQLPARRALSAGARHQHLLPRPIAQWEFFAFGGDQWQVTPKLTLDLGLRWEFYPPATPPFPGGFSNYDPTTNNLVIAGVGGIPSNLGMKTRYNYFAPRIGSAYRLTKKP